MRYHIKIVAAVLLTASILSGSCTAVLAAPSSGDGPVEVEAVAGFDQVAKIGSWVPVHVYVKNNGPAFRANVSVEYPEPSNVAKSEIIQQVYLPEGSHKRVTFYIPAYEMLRSVDVTVSGGLSTVKARAALTTAGYNELFVGVLSDDQSAMSHLSSLKFPVVSQVRVLHLSKEDIPEQPRMLSAIDVIVIANYDTSQLSTSQLEALRGWVSLGGNLLVSGGPTWQKTLRSLPEDLLPVTVNGSEQVRSLSALASKGGRGFGTPGPYTISKSRAKPGTEVVVAEGGTPVVAIHGYGAGRVAYWALDLTLDPLASWSGNPALWQSELPRLVPWLNAGTSKELIAPSLFRRSSQVAWALRNLPNFVVPSTQTLAVMLLGYLVLIGPLNYLVLKRMRRLELTWISIPALAFSIAVLAFFISFYFRGRDVFTNTISVVTIGENRPATASTYVGVFAPTKRTYSLVFEGRPTVMPLPMYFERYYDGTTEPKITTRIIQGEGTTVEFPAMSMWSMQAVQIDEHLKFEGEIRAELYPVADGLRGRVTNMTKYDLKDCLLVTRHSFAKIGDLKAGASADISLKIEVDPRTFHGPFLIDRIFEQAPPRPYEQRDYRDQMRKRQVLSTVIGNPYEEVDNQSAPVTFLGWSERPLTSTLPKTRMSSQSPYLGLLVMPVSFSVPKGEVDFPPGLVKVTAVSDGASGSRIKAGPGFYFVDQGEVVFQMELPVPGKHVTSLSLHIMALIRGSTAGSIEGYLYNHGTGRWDRFDVTPGANSVPNPSQYVSDKGIVMFKVTNSGSNPVELRDPTVSFSGRVE